MYILLNIVFWENIYIYNVFISKPPLFLIKSPYMKKIVTFWIKLVFFEKHKWESEKKRKKHQLFSGTQKTRTNLTKKYLDFLRCRFWTERSFTFFRNQKCENFLTHFFAKLPNYENKNLQSEIFLLSNFQKYQKSENFVQFSRNLKNLTDIIFTNVYERFTNKMVSSKSNNLITT